MSSNSSNSDAFEFFTSASVRSCLPLVQVNPPGILTPKHNNPFVYAFRVFRYGALISSNSSHNLCATFNEVDLRFSEIPRSLGFDVVVSGFISPKVRILVFPLYLNVSYRRVGNHFQLILPGSVRVDWKAKLAAAILKVTLRERHLYGRKTVWMSNVNSLLGGLYG